MKVLRVRKWLFILTNIIFTVSGYAAQDLTLQSIANGNNNSAPLSQNQETVSKSAPVEPIIEDQIGSQFSNKVIDLQNQDQIKTLTVFGENLFSKQCSSLPQIALYNPEYLISIGDQISLTLWGAFEYTSNTTVDSQGNIFIPKVGPVHVANIPNKDLNDTINSALKKTFEKNVTAYANLLSAQPIQVFVSGYVNNPGLYDGISSDSILFFLCKSGGIIPGQGSFREINLIRHGKSIATIDLYDFLLDGIIPYAQLQQGDSIVVRPVTSSVTMLGKVRVPAQYEPKLGEFRLYDLIELSGQLPDATYVLIEDSRGLNPVNYYLPLSTISERIVKGGETITLTSDQNIKELTISITGAIYGPHQFVVPIGTTLADVKEQIKFRSNASIANLQLFRESVAKSQKAAIDSSLRYLEQQAYTNSALTKDGLAMQQQYASLVSTFVEKASKVEPKGQVIVGTELEWNRIALQNNDVIHIPNQTRIITISGQVMSPMAVSQQQDYDIEDYIKESGGYTPSANTDFVLLLHENGRVEKVDLGMFSSDVYAQGGDQIVVTPDTMSEALPIVATISQIIFQIAIAARVFISP